MNIRLKGFYVAKTILLILAVVSLTACQTSTTKSDKIQVSKSELSTEVKQKYAYALQLMGAGNNDAALKMLNGVSDLNNRLSGP